MRRSRGTKFFLQSDGNQDDEEQSGNEESSRTVEGLGELDVVDQAIFDARRYLGMSSAETLSLTPRELAIEMRAYTEYVYDEYERMASQAMMTRAAYHAKKLKPSQLFKRPVDGSSVKNRAEHVRKRTEETMKWLAQFEEFRGKEGINGE